MRPFHEEQELRPFSSLVVIRKPELQGFRYSWLEASHPNDRADGTITQVESMSQAVSECTPPRAFCCGVAGCCQKACLMFVLPDATRSRPLPRGIISVRKIGPAVAECSDETVCVSNYSFVRAGRMSGALIKF